MQPANLIDAVALEESPVNASLLVNGAASDFDCAFGSYVVVGALIGEEFEDGLQTADRWPYDQRTVAANQSRYSQNSCTALGVYTPLQAARVSAATPAVCSKGWTDAQVAGRTLLIARTCRRMKRGANWRSPRRSARPSSRKCMARTVIYGTKITRTQALDSAIARSARRSRRSGPRLALRPTASRTSRSSAERGHTGRRQDDGGTRGRCAGSSRVCLERTKSNSNTRRQNKVFNENGASGTFHHRRSACGIRAATYANDPAH